MLKFELYKFESKKKINFKYPRPSYFNGSVILIKLIYDNEFFCLGEINTYSGNFTEIIKNLNLIFSNIKNKNLYNENVFTVLKKLKKIRNNSCFNSCIAGVSQAIIGVISQIQKKNVPNLILEKKVLPKKKVNAYASGGMVFEGQEEILIKEAEYCKENNFFGFKFRPSYPKKFNHHNLRFIKPDFIEVKKFLKIAEKIRYKVGNKFKLMVDLGCRLKNVHDIKYFLDAQKELNFYFIEEPFPRKLYLYEKIKNFRSIAAGEHLFDLDKSRKWLKCKKINYIQFDPNSLNLIDIFFLCKGIKTKDKIYIPHNWTTPINTSVGLNLLHVLDQEISLIEKNLYLSPFESLFINNSYKFTKGRFILVNKIGFDIKFNLKNFNKFKIKKINFN